MECRICLEDNDRETMVRPCACRGTAEWVHRECLLRYLEFYPNGVCHVCRQSMFHKDPTLDEYWAILPFVFALYASNAELAVKLVLFLGVLTVSYFLRNTHAWVALGASIVLALYGAFSPSVAMNVAIVVLVALYTTTMYVPVFYLCVLLVLFMLFSYALALTYILHQYLDGWANGVFNVVFVLLWGLWIRHRPAVHIE
jgi:E3 ubiquitin-protein ligase DOA10